MIILVRVWLIIHAAFIPFLIAYFIFIFPYSKTTLLQFSAWYIGGIILGMLLLFCCLYLSAIAWNNTW